ncbi:microspore-specific promoter 2 [Euphorbia peplus]|nr:microspore-specific promoter 2 [Euphorbia peplus]
MEESKTHIPLVTRLEHLDFVMKSLEAKQELSKLVDERQPPMISLDMAAREAYFRGSLMDRVAFLERRLFQLCLEMESSSRSSGLGSGSGSGTNSSSQSSGTEALSSTQGPKSNINLNHAYNLQDYLPPNHIIPTQPINKEKNQKEGGKDSKEREQKSGKNNKKGNGDENKSKSGRKKTPPKWHVKILGC